MAVGRRGDFVRVLLAGIKADRNAAPITSCPYPRGDLRRTSWIRGYSKRAPFRSMKGARAPAYPTRALHQLSL
ncbi:Rmf/CrpP fold protein [Streptomyces sp. NPDC088116]|uniref:Rmf/CrpP fold protein n=1 Tax=Streptomyces sp. NPDC088116 TaxID=3365825 RepID=UPI0037F9FA29